MQKDSQMSQDPSQPSDGIEILVPKASEPPATYLATGSPLTLQRDSEDAQTEEVDPKEPLEPFDWDALEERYHVKMQECQQTEEGIYADFATWIKVFETWASVTTSHENERSHKRLRTRTSFVQSAEERLEEKRKHYMKVVRAFESALALLGEGG